MGQTYLQLKPLAVSDLPVHPDLSSQQSSSISIRDFLTSAVKDALELVDNTIPSSFKMSGTKSAAPSSAKVQILSGQATHGSSEWFARRSIHKDQDIFGTATWAQFENGLRVDHSRHEKEYTPDVFDANPIVEWDLSQLSITGELNLTEPTMCSK
jgi:hypothetical protein